MEIEGFANCTDVEGGGDVFGRLYWYPLARGSWIEEDISVVD